MTQRARYRTDPEYRERHLAIVRRHYQRHRLEKIAAIMAANKSAKGRARDLLHKAILRGDVLRPETCSRCGSKERIHGHHTDYSKPLDVVWLCSFCHAAEHRKAD